MLHSGGFFRRNKTALWLGVAAFMAVFVSVQFGKALSQKDSHYGEIAECNYTHDAPELQTPASPQHHLESLCLSSETKSHQQQYPAGG
ncbi:hypothetical protein EV673_3217 [Limnobacter thiooxidans]|uniref:Uncharacterized protein n=1 Tax=Limnobacter thiooxidans TaxID=131080 RepID=A0AA86IYA0_9BURK|nr:hypothetical protein [Limnobacter sp.]MCZ8017108.1 hypothetical protein [Limnobacter sp.]RZS37242.1 hypothetical protein EV673_3217 [Limnobacter thiooxidans]BET25503.1 hypothetical protein RGQ30_10040 [Limnobacter thiooxidans]